MAYLRDKFNSMIDFLDKLFGKAIDGIDKAADTAITGIDTVVGKKIDSFDESVKRKIDLIDSGIGAGVSTLAGDMQGAKKDLGKFTDTAIEEIKDQVKGAVIDAAIKKNS